MKKLIVVTALILLTGVTFGQTLQKGSVVGLHVLTVDLDPDVTMNQFMDFLINTYVPVYEESHPGLKLYIAEGIRGEDENTLGLFFIFNSVEERDKYWPEKDEPTELASKAFEKIRPTYEDLIKLGTFSGPHTDWLIR